VSSVDLGLIDAMRITSLSHLVAVSGANCAIVVALVVGLVALLGGGIWLRMIFGVLALVGFVVLVTPEPSIIRASVMASIVLVFLASSRPVRGIPVLGVTVLVLLAIDPWLATDFAFALSVLATGGILVLTGPLVGILSRYLPTGLALVVALPLAAQVACQPVLILLNPIIPTWAIVANALAAPAAPVATIMGMLACIAGPLAPGLAQVLLWLAWWPAEYIAAIGRVLADTPLSFLPWPPGWWGAIAVAVIGYSAITVLLLPKPRPRLAVTALSIATVVTLVTVLVGFSAPRGMLRSSVPTEWTIAQCDVGQGDALLVRLGESVVMIDTGRYPQELRECLSLLRVGHIDLLVITHFDDDHVGAWRVVADITSEVWVGVTQDARKDSFVGDFLAAGIPVTEVHEGHSLALDQGELRVLWPTAAPLADEGNDSSIVVSLVPSVSCVSCLSGLFLGDLGEKPQRMIHGRHALRAVDVVKVSHHGSADQFPGLYQSLVGTIALIGVGSENTYGHPTESILGVLEQHSTVLRSDLLGTVTLHKNHLGDIVVWSARSAQHSVAP
jgi:competence protein ComEC